MGILQFDKSRPYAFVSYKREDNAVVLSDIKELQKRGVNVWFDEDLTAGMNWDMEAKPILASKKCSLVIFYASPLAIASLNVQKEIVLAAKWKKPMLPINFFKKSFMSVYQDEIDENEQLNNQQICGALDLVTNYLSDDLTFISREELRGDDYYDAMIKSISRIAPDIIKDANYLTPKPTSSPTQQPLQPSAPTHIPQIISPQPVPIQADFRPFSFDADFDKVVAIEYDDEQQQVQGSFMVSLITSLCKKHSDNIKELLGVMPLKRLVANDNEGVYIPVLDKRIVRVPDNMESRLKQLIENLEIPPELIKLGYSPNTKPTHTVKTYRSNSADNLSINESTSVYKNEMKIGERAKTAFSRLFEDNMLSDDEVSMLCQLEYTKSTFGITHPVLKNIPNEESADEAKKDSKGNNRYYRDVYYYHNKYYLLCSQWYDKQRTNLEDYLGRYGI